jgi:serine/threonine-protein kinase
LALTPGSRLGPYEITTQIGAGGMGEVYQATDSHLKRSVAIKVLPASVASDADRLARFQREAEVLAALNHPNIAAIYGLEKTLDITALVMELVEGEDLSAHIARGPIAIADALPIAKQVADALEAAHEQGIIHRDLKPANIKVRADGTVKVLDFGLAKAMDPAGASSGEAMNSPTMTGRATQMGMILGTAAYMAPEQAKGKSVDKRADIWAFGVVVYEMVTGWRGYHAEDVSDTLAAVLTRDVDWTKLPATTSPRLVGLIRSCLVRDPKQRLRDIGDARLVLDRIIAGAPDDAGAAPVAIPAIVPTWRRALPWAVAAMGLGAALVSLALWAPWRSTPAPTPRRLLASIGVDASLVTDRGAGAILSPDGTTLVFSAQQDSQARLFIRKLDQLQAAPLAGTEGAVYPFFSPNGQWIAFFAGTKLKKVSVAGGAAVNLCNVESGRGGTWTEDDTIIFGPSGGENAPLLRVPAAGGKPTPFGTLSQGAITQRWPQVLPGGHAVLFTEHSGLIGFDGANIVVAPVPADASAKAGLAKVVVSSAYYGRYVPSGLASPKRGEREGGHLLYIQQGTLFAVPFDPVRLETVGPAAPAIEGLMSSVSSGGAQVDVSRDGTLAYVPGATTTTVTNPIDWITRDGKTSGLRAAKSEWGNPRFSPDGQKMAMDISDGKQRDVWVYDWARDALTQLTFDAGNDTTPVWTPDGKRLVFASNRVKPGGPSNLYWVNADGTGEVTRLTDSPDSQYPFSWHPSGKFLGFTANRAGSGWDLLILPMEGDAAKGWTAGTPTVFLGTPANEVGPMFSPDGRFVAYFSTEAGGTSYDVYVRSFPGPGGQWRVSTAVGIYPRWSATTRELVWVNGQAQGKLMFAPFSIAGDAFVPSKPQLWSPMDLMWRDTNSYYDLHPDGKRVAAAARQTQTTVQDHVVVMSHFFDYLRTIAR